MIFACDSRATRRGPRGVGGGRRAQLREHNEDAPALRRSFFQAGHAGSIPVTRSHRDVQVRHHSPGVNLRRFSPLDHPRAIRARLARRLAGIAGGVTVALDQRFETVRDLAIRTLCLVLVDQRGSHAVVAHARHQDGMTGSNLAGSARSSHAGSALDAIRRVEP